MSGLIDAELWPDRVARQQIAAVTRRFDPVFECIGHRFLGVEGPENTLYALCSAASRGVRSVEYDVMPTADGGVILMHDETVDRTVTGFSGATNSFTSAEFATMDAGSKWGGGNFNKVYVPTHAQALAFMKARGIKPYCEIKGSWWTEDNIHILGESVAAAGMEDHVTFTAFDSDLLVELRRTNARSGMIMNVEAASLSHISRLNSLKGGTETGIFFPYDEIVDGALTAEMVAAYRAAGHDVLTWITGQTHLFETKRMTDIGVYRVITDWMLTGEDAL